MGGQKRDFFTRFRLETLSREGSIDTSVCSTVASRRKLGVIVFSESCEVLFCSPEVPLILRHRGLSENADGEINFTQEQQSRIRSTLRRCFEDKNTDEKWAVFGEFDSNALVVSYHYALHDQCEFTHTKPGLQNQGVVVVVMRSPTSDLWEDDEQRIVQAFNLTKREAQLALHLSRGRDLSEFADSNYLSINTVKSHLRQLFKKIGVKKQLQVPVVVLAALR